MKLPVLQWKDYKSDVEIIWCPGCGDFAVLSALYHALAELQIPRHQISIVSGIGCSSRLPGYVATYGFNAIHGRPLPIAEGVKLANPELTVLAVGGDGDGLAIGAGHFPHAARRNINMTYIMMDNGIYGLTKGQTSPTTPSDLKTKSSYYGNPEQPVNPAVLAIAYNASLVCRGTASNPKFLREIFKKGIQHPGFAFMHVLSPCVTYRGGELFDYYRSNSQIVDESHDPEDRFAAYRLAEQESPIMVGELYRNIRPTLEERLENACVEARSGPQNFQKVLGTFAV